MLSNRFSRPRRTFDLSCLTMIWFLMAATVVWGQSTASNGSIQGTIIDPTGAVVPNAHITITNKATGEIQKISSSGTGIFSSGPLTSGNYELRVQAPGFQTAVTTIAVEVGVSATGNTRLSVGKASEIAEVTGSALTVNTEQATVQGVLNAQQIDDLPINGRNFLDFAQLEPGVQIQDGGNFDPTKKGFSSISFGGRFGRTARIEVDGIDLSDETVGTTTQNIPAGAISEFQISQSMLDLSTELTSSGAVNVVTRSGTNHWHGDGFYLFRDHSIAADIADHDVPFQRNQFGGRFGGPVIANTLFFFAAVERVKQDTIDQVAPGGNFIGLASGFNSPFRDTNGIARLDWQIQPGNYHLFYRFSYEQLLASEALAPEVFQPFNNGNHTPVHVVGFDFNTGSYTHSVRFGFTKFRNLVSDAVAGSPIFNPVPGIDLSIGPNPFCFDASDEICTGPAPGADQGVFQENVETKYDGGKIIRSHILRYGFVYNHIQGSVFLNILALAPAVNSPATGVPVANLFPGGATNPLNYPVQNVFLGNGLGFFSEKPAFGLAGGGMGPDNRIGWYVGDSWKLRPNLTITYGVRYSHDTGRTDSDLGPLPILNQLSPGLGSAVKNPALNFAPQFGFAWSPRGSAKMVVRGGIGVFYENSIFNNNLFDRPGRLAQGLFAGVALVCGTGAPVPLTLPGTNTVVNPTFCGQPIGSVFQQIIQLQKQFQAATLAAGPASNPSFIGNTLSATSVNNSPFAPDYKTPRATQMNIGIQRELAKGVVFTADYVRNVETHTLLAVDVNHVGDARFFNKTNALAAISATTAAKGCAGGSSAAAINCAIGAGATIADFAGNGLDSGNNLCGGGPCPGAAFPGQNTTFGTMAMLFPSGRSVYNGLQTSLRVNMPRPINGIRNVSWQVSYALSSYISTAADSDFVNSALDNNNPTKFIGPNGLDRKHQFSFGGSLDLPLSLRFSAMSHFYSPLPLTLRVPGAGSGGIFVSDLTGDGSGDGSGVYPLGDVLTGTKVGAFGRSIQAGNLNSVINAYNQTEAGQPTPAGQILIQNGLFTLVQLQALGGVQEKLALAPPGEAGPAWLRALDLRLGWAKKITENLAIEPSVSFFNAFNFANFDAPRNTLSGVLDGTVGSVNGTTVTNRNRGLTNNRVTPGSGTFGLGSPRVIEFGMRLSF